MLEVKLYLISYWVLECVIFFCRRVSSGGYFSSAEFNFFDEWRRLIFIPFSIISHVISLLSGKLSVPSEVLFSDKFSRPNSTLDFEKLKFVVSDWATNQRLFIVTHLTLLDSSRYRLSL